MHYRPYSTSSRHHNPDKFEQKIIVHIPTTVQSSIWITATTRQKSQRAILTPNCGWNGYFATPFGSWCNLPGLFLCWWPVAIFWLDRYADASRQQHWDGMHKPATPQETKGTRGPFPLWLHRCQAVMTRDISLCLNIQCVSVFVYSAFLS